MKCNVGTTDKVIRIILGLGLGAAGLYFKSWWGLVGLVPFLTAVTGFCPIYPIFGVSTCKAKTEETVS